ncbi:MAG: CvpA family protein [Planctomycetaceae bacterium]
MIDIALLVVLAIVTWCVAGEGVWGAALVFLSALFSGFIAMNFFEPIAGMLSSGGSWDYYWDFVALVGLFTACVFGCRLLTEYLMPVYVEVLPLLYDVGRWAFALGAGYVTMAFLATALHTAPLPRDFLGFSPENKMLFGLAPDRQWLAMTQYATERIYSRGRIFDGEQYPTIPERWQRSSSEFDREKLMATWSSFPMRYAFRREEFIRTGGAPPAAPSVPVAPAPSGGGGGGRPAF